MNGVSLLHVHHVDLFEVFSHDRWLERRLGFASTSERGAFLLFEVGELLFFGWMELSGRLHVKDSFLFCLPSRDLQAMVLAWFRDCVAFVLLRGSTSVVGYTLALDGVEDGHVLRALARCR